MGNEWLAHGVDIDLNHAPISWLSTVTVMPPLVVKLNLKVNQMDVSTEFKNAVLEDVVYILPPPGLENLVLNFKSLMMLKALYG